PEIREICLPIVIGDQGVVSQVLNPLGKEAGIKFLKELSRDFFDPGMVNVLDTGNVDLKQITAGQASAAGGRAVFEDLQRAVELARGKKIDGFVAGPHNKYSVNLAGVHFAGYPPLVARLTGSRYAFNMLTAGGIRIVGATLHVALKDVSKTLTPDLVQATILAAGDAVKRLGIPDPRIAVAGLNPHCGEEGLFGEEDETILKPAIERARQAGFQVFGPLPADSLFAGIKEKQEYDAYVAMYHDQSHIPIKTVAFDSLVGLIIGTPLIAATVGHGTAFEIAGKGIANPRPMIEAIKLVAKSSGPK
ncbi:MAG: 4-hydroxythreonine-4-phosphate dehydrogenase PdxA, partial [Deltaproteobacteria bacterium]|nr:4-hydroxythreonine-4-phosphate dehydrogenase PdxA [Deltaproteobacteria bacterium]